MKIKSDNYKDSIRKRLLNSSLILVFDSLRNGKFPMILFALSVISVGRYSVNFLEIFNTDKYTLGLMMVAGLVFFIINYYVIRKKSRLNPSIQFVRIFSLGIAVFLGCIISLGGLAAALLLLPYLFYFFNIALLYFYSEGLIPKERDSTEDKLDYERIKKEMILKNINYVKLISLGLHLLSFITYLLIGNSDPLYITTFFCVTPLFTVVLFLKRIESLFLLYRILFIVIFFFISTTLDPYLLLFGLLVMWVGKFYYFIKYNIKYPSFYKSYDIS